MTSFIDPTYLNDELTSPVDSERGNTGENSSNNGTQTRFGLFGDPGFAPHFVPTRFSVVKERNLDRSKSFCGGEDVSDLGSKNKDIHISGWIRHSEIRSFNGILDSSDTHDLITPGWTGQVRVKAGEYEGPQSLDPHSGESLYKYSMDVVSTGVDESESDDSEPEPVDEFGIISEEDLQFTD